MKPSPHLKMSVMALIAQEPSANRLSVKRLRTGGVAALLVLWALLGLGLREDPGQRPPSLMVATALSWAFVATASTWLAWAQGTRRFWGAPQRALVALVLGGPLLLAAFTLLAQVGWPAAETPAPNGPWVGAWRVLSFGLALVPLLACIWLGPRIDPVHPRALGAALGSAAASWAGLILSLTCGVTTPLHVIIGHVLPVFASAFVGLVMGSVFLDLRKQPPPSVVPPPRPSWPMGRTAHVH